MSVSSSPCLIDSSRGACNAGIKTALGGAGIALISSFIALGALMGDAGFSLTQAVLFSLFGFALPGQLVAAELSAHGVNTAAITITVWLVNARLLPMTIVLLPLLRQPQEKTGEYRWRNLFVAHLVAVTSWACFLASYHTIAPARRRQYFIVIAVLLWLLACLSTAIGFYIGNQLPHPWLVSLLFLNPAYFLCLMLVSLTRKSNTAAFIAGAALLPVLHQFSSEWDILICGLIGGVAGFYFFDYRQKRET